MAANKPRPTLADYVAIAISPVLIMVLVASLVFFLLEILYVGQYQSRLNWVMFWFVFATVLIARMAMTSGIAERAPVYGLVLAVAAFVALQMLVEYPVGGPAAGLRWAINLGVMAVIWWSAHRLTWDCTFIDENVDASGAGLLDAAGLEGAAQKPAVAEETERDPPARSARRNRDEEGGLLNWWERYHHFRKERQQQPHAPGLWVVYFSLAALPLFGLGQALIPAGEAARRQYVFWLMVYYVSSGLGLLLTTSFLGLRRYLRQRQLKMPAAMTGTWLAIGTALVAVLLLLGALLPRPNAEYAIVKLPAWLGSPDRDASNYAVMRDAPGKGEGRPGAAGKDGKAGGADGAGAKGQGGGEKGANGSGGNAPKGAGGGEKGQGQGRQGSGDNSSQGKAGADQGANKGEPGQSGAGKGTNSGDRNGSKGGSNSSAGGKQGEKQAGQNVDRLAKEHQGETALNPPASSLSSLMRSLGRLLKWIVFAVLALVVLFLVLRALLKFLANFTGWARGLLAALQGLWQSLFGWWGESTVVEAAEEETSARRQPVPFSAFHNPFMDGSDGRQSPEELVRYSFEALEAWAWERGLERQSDATPLEFADRIALEIPTLASAGRHLAALYARAAYGQGTLPASCLGAVRQFWQRLETVGEDAITV